MKSDKPNYVITDYEAQMIKDQAETSSIILLSIKKCDIPYTDGEKACDGVEATFGIAARMERDFVMTQTVPLPPGMDFNSVGDRMHWVIDVARAALRLRFRKLAGKVDEQLSDSSSRLHEEFLEGKKSKRPLLPTT